MSYQPFHRNFEDLDRIILFNVGISDFKSLIRVNKYVSGILIATNYWIDRINHLSEKFTMDEKFKADFHDDLIKWLKGDHKKHFSGNYLIQYGRFDKIFNQNLFFYPSINSLDLVTSALNDKLYHTADWLMNIFGLLPDFDYIIKNGKLDLIKILVENLGLSRHIDPNLAIRNNQTDIFLYFYYHGIAKANNIDLNYAVKNGYLKLLKHMPSNLISSFVVCPDALNETILKGNLEMTEWLIENNVRITSKEILSSIRTGRVDFLRKFISRIIFNPIYFTQAIEINRTDIIVMFLEDGLKPSSTDIDIIIRRGDISLLRIFSCFLIYPNQSHADLAVAEGSFEILEWMEIGGIFPSEKAANIICGSRRGFSDRMLDWLQDHHIYPDKEGANKALENGNYYALSTLKEQNIYPDLEGIKATISSPHSEAFDFLFNNIPKDQHDDFVQQFHQLLANFGAVH